MEVFYFGDMNDLVWKYNTDLSPLEFSLTQVVINWRYHPVPHVREDTGNNNSELLPLLRTDDCRGLKARGPSMTPPDGCTGASVLSPLQSSCRLGSSSPVETDLAVLGGLVVKTQALFTTKSHVLFRHKEKTQHVLDTKCSLTQWMDQLINSVSSCRQR